jgi:RNA polymerase sigma-70 factor (ECF subfamily)
VFDRQLAVELLRDPDADLIAACRNPNNEGFEAAFEQIYHRYRDRVYSIAYRITSNAVDAMDIVQESFGLVFRKLDSFRSDSLFSTWLFRLVVNCSIDQRRRDRARAAWQSDQLDRVAETVLDPSVSPDSAAQASEFGQQVQAALALLSQKLRVVLALRYLEDMSYEQLAATLSLSLGTVKSRLARAHLALERVLRDRFPHLETVVEAGRRAGGGA